MASRFIVVFSAIVVLAQGSNILPIEQESEVAVHSGVVSAGAPVVVQGHPSVHSAPRPILSHGPLPIPVAGPHGVIRSGLAHRPAPVVYSRPATVVVPAPRVVVPAPRVVVAPAHPIRQPHGVAVPVPVPVPVVVGAGHGNVHRNPHHG